MKILSQFRASDAHTPEMSAAWTAVSRAAQHPAISMSETAPSLALRRRRSLAFALAGTAPDDE
jgi:hypothetical protein